MFYICRYVYTNLKTKFIRKFEDTHYQGWAHIKPMTSELYLKSIVR